MAAVRFKETTIDLNELDLIFALVAWRVFPASSARGFILRDEFLLNERLLGSAVVILEYWRETHFGKGGEPMLAT